MKPEKHWAQFERFEIELPAEAVAACHHQGACGADVVQWAPRIARPENCTPKALAAELEEYGAWDAEELADDAANWRRIIWLAAGNIQEEEARA
jgi:hypothetical protein